MTLAKYCSRSPPRASKTTTQLATQNVVRRRERKTSYAILLEENDAAVVAAILNITRFGGIETMKSEKDRKKLFSMGHSGSLFPSLSSFQQLTMP